MKYIYLCLLILTNCGKTTYSVTELPKGTPGTPGANGTSCSVSTVPSGALIACSDGSYAFVDKGDPGTPAVVNPYGIAAVIDPCGDEGSFDEVLLKLNNGTILAHYSDGTRQFMTVIGAGSYSTTDGHACNFSIDNQGVVTW